MGTNYYHVTYEGETCPHCGRSDHEKRRHIGKSSSGWCFSLHVEPGDGPQSLEDWKALLASGFIENEYGERVSLDDLLSIITERDRGIPWGDHRQWMGYRDEADFHRRNESQRGPNGLLRHRLGDHCIGHGEGTWDLVRGEFS